MPATSPRVTAVVDKELAAWLRRRSKVEGRSISLLVRDILAKQYAEDEERYWARQGEQRLDTFDPDKAISHAEAWK